MRDMGPISKENDDLKNENQRLADLYNRDVYKLESDNEKLVKFARKIIHAAFEGGSYDGGEVQELGVKTGLLQEELYSREKHGDLNFEFEEGDKVFVFTDALTLPEAPETAQAEGVS